MEPRIEVGEGIYKDTKLSVQYFDELLASRNELFDKKMSDLQAHEKFLRLLCMRY